jgi:hypothetical protein
MSEQEILGSDSGINIESLMESTDGVSLNEGEQSDLIEFDDSGQEFIESLSEAQEVEEEKDNITDFTEESTDSEVKEIEPPKEVIKAKAGEKELDIPKDAQIDVKINGKIEAMSLQDIINKASGGVHLEREVSKLGRERAEFDSTVNKVNATVNHLMEINDPYELCEKIAELKGGNPDEIYQKMLQETLNSIEKYSKMTPEQITLERENRKLARQNKEYQIKENLIQEQKQKEESRVAFHNSLKEEGIEVVEFEETLSDIAEKAKNGEELGFGLDNISDPTENDIVDYILAKKLDDRVMTAIDSIDGKLAKETEFIDRVKVAILRTEAIPGGGKMSPEEVKNFIKIAFEKDNKALSESLSKKVSNTKSKLVNSEEQEEDGDSELLEEFLNRF